MTIRHPLGECRPTIRCSLIKANLATYPPREGSLQSVVKTLSPQVDVLNVVLNQYRQTPRWLKSFDNVNALIPDRDLKDVGKFYPEVSRDDLVFLVDDDINYPVDYVETTKAYFKQHSEVPTVGGFHGSIYKRPDFSIRPKKFYRWLRYTPSRIATYRDTYWFIMSLSEPIIVDQLGTGVAVLRGAELPTMDYMQGSQGFVDVRLARWCFENGIRQVCLPRNQGWLGQHVVTESIYQSFTSELHPEVADEILRFAFSLEGKRQIDD